MTIEKAYVLGMVLGGGELTAQTVRIGISTRRWGAQPGNTSMLSTDISGRISTRFHDTYGLSIAPYLQGRSWILAATSPTLIRDLQRDLASLGLPTTGNLLRQADFSVAQAQLGTTPAAQSFLAGFCDVRASVADSQRRFSSGAPIISVELPDSIQNFRLVVQLCSWMTSLGSTTDQILYSHPSQQAAKDPYYEDWKKGHKIRLLAGAFVENLSFGLRAKIAELKRMKIRQTMADQLPCRQRSVAHAKIVSLHSQLGSNDVRPEVRGKVYLHYMHLCAALGCPYANVAAVNQLLDNYETKVSAFPICSKGATDEIRLKYADIVHRYYGGVTQTQNLSVSDLLRLGEVGHYPGMRRALASLFSAGVHSNRPVGEAGKTLARVAGEILQVTSSGSQCPIMLIVNVKAGQAAIVSSMEDPTNQAMVQQRIRRVGLELNVR